jgi:hypothetical protein
MSKIELVMQEVTPLTEEEKEENQSEKENNPKGNSLNKINNLNYYYSKSWKKTGKFKIKINNICNVVLKNGEKLFISTLDIMKNFEGMNLLKWSDDLCLPISDNFEDITKRETISNLLSKIEDLGKFSNIGFYYDIGIKNPIISTVLQIVDDSPFRGNRRNNIMNSTFTHIGITSKIINGNICSYFTFGNILD